MTSNDDETLLLQEYEDALTYFLTHCPTSPAEFDLRIRLREYDAWTALSQCNLLNDPGYASVVENARRRADATQTQHA
jgi:hypothetical protein